MDEVSVLNCILYNEVSQVKADLGESQEGAGGNSVCKSYDDIEYQDTQMSKVDYVSVEKVTGKRTKARS